RGAPRRGRRVPREPGRGSPLRPALTPGAPATHSPHAVDLFLDVPRDGWQASVAFWSAAARLTPSPTRGEDGQFLTLLPAAGTSCVRMQAIDGGPRVHLDVASHDRDALLRRALDLGATEAWRYEDVPVLRSPGGLLFCLTLAEPGPRLERPADLVLDQVCLDIPPRLWDAEVAFWQRLSGRGITTGRADHFARLVDPDPAGGLRFLLQRLGEERPSSPPTPTSRSPTGPRRSRATAGWAPSRSPSTRRGRSCARPTGTSTASPTATPRPVTRSPEAPPHRTGGGRGLGGSALRHLAVAGPHVLRERSDERVRLELLHDVRRPAGHAGGDEQR